MPTSIPQNFSNDISVGNSQDSSIFGIFKLLMSQSKMLSVIFILLLCVQLETTQGLFRKVTRMIKVPDGMVFTTSKVLSAFIGVIVFFIVHRNL
jgi:hypothetical protein